MLKKKEFLITDKKESMEKIAFIHSIKKQIHLGNGTKKYLIIVKKIICFSSPFDESAVDFLEKFNPPLYKIASFENNHFPLIKKVIDTKKPIIISLGMITQNELKELIKFLKNIIVKNIFC